MTECRLIATEDLLSAGKAVEDSAFTPHLWPECCVCVGGGVSVDGSGHPSLRDFVVRKELCSRFGFWEAPGEREKILLSGCEGLHFPDGMGVMVVNR